MNHCPAPPSAFGRPVLGGLLFVFPVAPSLFTVKIDAVTGRKLVIATLRVANAASNPTATTAISFQVCVAGVKRMTGSGVERSENLGEHCIFASAPGQGSAFLPCTIVHVSGLRQRQEWHGGLEDHLHRVLFR